MQLRTPHSALELSMIRKRKTTVCLETWYYLVVMGFILAGAMLREINLLIVLFGMMVGPLLYNWRAVDRHHARPAGATPHCLKPSAPATCW